MGGWGGGREEWKEGEGKVGRRVRMEGGRGKEGPEGKGKSSTRGLEGGG